ncbi:MAG: cytochrome c biogenesis protein ResB [Clostridia bacterium]|nr:cytochrome c biogenesis protein ResB [Clostridia bacterium]
MKKILGFFRSMTFGMILLVLVIACSLAGSLIPQQEAAMVYVKAYGASTAQLLIALGLTDVFHTWYFYLLEILLCLNLVLCSILRFPKTLRAADALKARTRSATPDHPLTAEQGEKLKAFLSSRHFRQEESASGTLYSKSLIGFYGSFLTHLSILLILLFGSLVLMTPEVTDLSVMPGQTLTLKDGTKVLCESFHIQDETGKLDYASVLTVTSADGSQTKTGEIRVNEPLRFGTYKIYQQTYGTAGRIRISNEENGSEEVQYLTEPCFLSIDRRNGIFFDALYPGYYQDEDGNYTLITSAERSYPDPVYSIQSIVEGMSTAVLAFPDEEIHIGNITFTFLSPAEYPGLRIKHVSFWLLGGLYFSFGLMVVALYLCFFAVPVCVRIESDGFAVCSPKSAQGFLLDIEAALDSDRNT